MEEKYREAAGKFGIREMVLLTIKDPGTKQEQFSRMLLGPVPSDPHGFDCLKVIEQLRLVVAKAGRSRIVLVTEEDEFDFCFEGRCTVCSCPRFPNGLWVAALKPFVERQF